MINKELIRVSAAPVYQNKMFDSAQDALACPAGDIILVQNMRTGLVFNDAFEPEKLCYDQSYQNEQGHSAGFKKHLSEVVEKIDRYFYGKNILEVGCGKGSFLDLIRQRGHNAFGIDPAYEGDAPYIYKHHFTPELGLTADAVILRHVLEHIRSPVEFLRSIAAANNDEGKIYIEVPSLEWIIERHAWFDVFYEHVNYFRLSDLRRMFRKIYQSGRLFGGQYIYIIADLSSLQAPEGISPDDFATFPENFFGALNRCVELSSNARKRVVWGAAAKGVMFAHHLKRDLNLNFAIDINPAKQGKFLAGSALPILSPEAGLAQLSAGDDVFVMNSNYLTEISGLGGSGLNYILAEST
jgi:SAM-dependent methyltransferase